jgi:hypothetical protein
MQGRSYYFSLFRNIKISIKRTLKMTKSLKQKTTPAPIVVNELNIRSADRGRKDIATWRNALIAAESIGNPNRVRLYDLYDDIITDGHLSGLIAKRTDAVLNKDLYFEKEGAKCHNMDALIHSLPFRQLVRTILETQLWGCSALEFLPGSTFSFVPVPRKHLRPELGLIAFEQSGNDGVAYSGLPNIWVMGNTGDLGLLLKCAPYALYKRGGLADWAEYIEIFGQPVRIMRYDSYDEQTKQELRRALDESGSSLTMMIPRQAEFEMLDGKQSNCDGNLQLSFIKALNEEMSVIVLGNTETTSSSYSSGYAQSRIHLEQQYEITKSDMAYAAAMLNDTRFLNILASYGYAVDGGRFVYARETDTDYLGKRMAIDKELAAIIDIPAAYWYDTYGIQMPA